MRRLVVDPQAPSAEAIAEAAAVIRGGGVVAFPTDTLYGLAADPRDGEAVERVYAIKGRAFDRPLPLIAADREQVERQVGTLGPLAQTLAAQFWPGPLTLVLEANPSLCGRVHAWTGGVAVRVPAHPAARALASAVGHPITATSANRSGEHPAATGDALAVALGPALDLVDLTLDGGATVGGPPSTIIDARGHAPTLVRAGAVPWARVLEFVECPPRIDRP